MGMDFQSTSVNLSSSGYTSWIVDPVFYVYLKSLFSSGYFDFVTSLSSWSEEILKC